MTQDTEKERAEFKAWQAKIIKIMEENGQPAGAQYMRESEARDFIIWQAARRAPVVPNGWKLVPIEPTAEMIEEARKEQTPASRTFALWTRMLAAAPQPPEANMGIPISGEKQQVAPAGLPEPVGQLHVFEAVASAGRATLAIIHRNDKAACSQPFGYHDVYTNQQMRAMYPGHPPFQTADGCSASNGETP